MLLVPFKVFVPTGYFIVVIQREVLGYRMDTGAITPFVLGGYILTFFVLVLGAGLQRTTAPRRVFRPAHSQRVCFLLAFAAALSGSHMKRTWSNHAASGNGMIRTFQTSVDDRDLRAMTRGKGSLGRNLLLVCFPAALFLFALVYVIWRSLTAASVVGVLALVASAWSNASFFTDGRRRQGAGADGQAVEVTEVHASRVFDIEPLGSHGPAWVFFAGDGKALLLVGQWLLRFRSFPSTSFRLYQWADTKRPIRLKPTGRRVKPERSAVLLRPSYRLTDVEVFQATPETLQHDLDRAFDKKAA